MCTHIYAYVCQMYIHIYRYMCVCFHNNIKMVFIFFTLVTFSLLLKKHILLPLTPDSPLNQFEAPHSLMYLSVNPW